MDLSCGRGPLISSVENFSRNSRTFVSSVRSSDFAFSTASSTLKLSANDQPPAEA